MPGQGGSLAAAINSQETLARVPPRDGLAGSDSTVSRNEAGVMAGQPASMANVLLKFSDVIKSLHDSALSPQTAAASVQELLQHPKVHRIAAHLEKDKDHSFVVYVRVNDIELPCDAEDNHKPFSYQTAIGPMTPEDATRLVRNGIAPILERFAVGPQQAPKEPEWLLNAAKMLVMGTNDNMKLFYREPAVVVEGEKTSALLTIHGVDPQVQDTSTWTYSTLVARFLIPSAAELNIPNEKNILWRRGPYWTEIGLAAGFRATHDWKLALFLTATFEGFLGSKADSGNRMRTVLTNLALPPAIATKAYYSLGSASADSIRKLMPWHVEVLSNYGGTVAIVRNGSSFQKPADSIGPIMLRSINGNVVVEVLTAMLTALITCGAISLLFARGTYTADLVAEDIQNGLEIPGQPICLSPGDHSHWHICTGCLNALPCSSNYLSSHSPTLCRTCVTDGKLSGWMLEAKLSSHGAYHDGRIDRDLAKFAMALDQIKETLRAAAKVEPESSESGSIAGIAEQDRCVDPSKDQLKECEGRNKNWEDRLEKKADELALRDGWMQKDEELMHRREEQMEESEREIKQLQTQLQQREDDFTRREANIAHARESVKQREEAVISREETLDEIFASAGAKERELNSRETDLFNLENSIVQAMDSDQQVDYLAAKMRPLDPAERERLLNSFPPVPAPQ